MKATRQRNSRWSPRRSFRWNVAISDQGTAIGGTVRDISIGGVRVDTDGATLAPNALVHIRFPGLAAAEYGFKANVIWVGNGHAGLMFSDYSPDVLRRLRKLISRASAEAGAAADTDYRVSPRDE